VKPRHILTTGWCFQPYDGQVDARSKAGVTPLHIAAIEGVESAAAWLLDRGAKLDAAVASDYEYLPHKMAPGYGNEMRLKRGSTPLRLASLQHGTTKWSSGRHRAVLELLKGRAGKGWFGR